MAIERSAHMSRKNLKDRFNNSYQVDTDTGCWIWTRFSHKGYGRAHANGHNIRAHRLSYELHVGPIPEGACVCHRCDVPSCVNPDHLFIGNHEENMKDMVSKGRGRGRIGTKHHSAKLDDTKVRKIRMDSRPCKVVAIEYGVDWSTIRDIKSRRSWRHVA